MSASACANAQSAAPVVAPAAPGMNGTSGTHADIGVGLEGLADWSRARMFADMIKTARGWGKPDQPGQRDIKTDALGWPTEDAGIIIAADAPSIGGTYQLSFDGKADVKAVMSRAEVRNLKFDAGTRKSTAEVVIPESGQSLSLAFTGTDGGVRNVRLLRPGYDGSATFTKPFLEKLAPFSTLRFMDMLSTNGNPVKTWSERLTPQHASQAGPKGVALEYIAELANVSGKDIWVNVPDQADDDYVRRMAQLLKDGLNKNQKVYVEWSNEVWNWQFRQAHRNLAAAKLEVAAGNSPLAYDQSTNEGYLAMRRIAKRSVEVGQIFREVFGDKDFSRVRPVYATQVGYREVYKQGLTFLENQYKQPNSVIYGIAGAPYFSIAKDLDNKKDLTVEEIFAAIPTDITKKLDNAIALGIAARYYNLKHLAYEGGQHLQDPKSLGNAAVKVAANRDPRMGIAVENYLDAWHALGGDLFVYYTLSGTYGKYGSWGLVDDITKTSPKFDAVLRVLNKRRAPLTIGATVGETIQAGTFAASSGGDKKDATEIRVDPKKWLHYAVRAPRAGTYKLTAEISSSEMAKADVLVNSQENGTLEAAPASQSATATVKLDAGLNVIRIAGRDGRFNLKSLVIN